MTGNKCRLCSYAMLVNCGISRWNDCRTAEPEFLIPRFYQWSGLGLHWTALTLRSLKSYLTLSSNAKHRHHTPYTGCSASTTLHRPHSNHYHLCTIFKSTHECWTLNPHTLVAVQRHTWMTRRPKLSLIISLRTRPWDMATEVSKNRSTHQVQRPSQAFSAAGQPRLLRSAKTSGQRYSTCYLPLSPFTNYWSTAEKHLYSYWRFLHQCLWCTLGCRYRHNHQGTHGRKGLEWDCHSQSTPINLVLLISLIKYLSPVNYETFQRSRRAVLW